MDIKKWNKYDEVGIGVGAYTDSILFKKYSFGKNKILDVGCGRGGYISKTDAHERYGVDLSSKAIDQAKKNYPEINFFVADVCQLPFEDNFFDFIYSLEVIEHVENYNDMLSEINRVLKPGGIVFIQTPNYPIKRLYDLIFWLRGQRNFLKDDYTHISKFSYLGLRKTLNKHFKILEIKSRNIFFGNRIYFFKKCDRSSVFALIFGQKTIIVGEKI